MPETLDEARDLLDKVTARLRVEQPGVKVEPSPHPPNGDCAQVMLRVGQDVAIVSRFPREQVFTMYYGRWVAGWQDRYLDERRPVSGDAALGLLREWSAAQERATDVTPLEVRLRREALGLSQSLMARALEIKKQVTISRWESGETIPSRGHMDDLARLEKQVDERVGEYVATPGPVVKLRWYGHPDMAVPDALERAALGRAIAIRRAQGVPTTVSDSM